jgi:ankyrin repeat protein
MTRFLGGCMVAMLIVTAGAATAPQPAAAPAMDRYQAIRSNDLARLKTLVGTRDEANARGPLGSTPLMDAAVAGSVEAMSFLLDKGAEVDAQNPFGTTALMMSATQIDKVKLLLDRGAKPNLASKQGRTAVFVAAMSEPSAAIVKLLIARGADVHATDAFQNTTLTAAAYGNDLATLRLMLDAGIDVNAAGITGVTPLLGAAYHGNLAAVRLLLSKGARANRVAAMPVLFPADAPKSGPVAISDISPLLAAASGESAICSRRCSTPAPMSTPETAAA